VRLEAHMMENTTHVVDVVKRAGKFMSKGSTMRMLGFGGRTNSYNHKRVVEQIQKSVKRDPFHRLEKFVKEMESVKK